ncbi:Tm-1-like ATP-binding domain-containing protein [Thalassotalea psychrophila]|uniref:Tm-1-like ATP-binding domain-containing protein n=1 Tax=Thalassotalea psychrophila TaxID=3065647 RepID=A0ABY9TTW3_9GAMM|nr:Tm-1-like ATP-binding domain-containing protein [Colwelliaceae bacterium SQ149]
MNIRKGNKKITSSQKTVVILATMDTKGVECDFLRKEIQSLGFNAFLIDISVVGVTNIEVNIYKDEVALEGGSSMAALLEHPSRQEGSEVMVKGSIKLMNQLIANQKVDAIVSLGGTQGTNNGCKVMQALPYAFPKLMVSTMASGDTSAFVGIKDITMMFSVSDILGLNPFFRRILSNAAGAACGMAESYQKIKFAEGKPIVGISNLGVLTQGTVKAIELFKQRGYESIVFHAIGSGSRAMEQMMKDGIITAVFDYGLGDIADALYDGVRAADVERLTVAGKLGLPQVIVPGGIDHIGILLDEPNTVPEKYKNHQYSYHNPVIFVPRTNGDEMIVIMTEISKRLAHSKTKTVFMLPTKGVSSYSAADGDLFDPKSDHVLQLAVKKLLPKTIELIEMDNNAEDTAFVEKAVDTLISLIEA